MPEEFRVFEDYSKLIEKKEKELGVFTVKIFKMICARWPTNPLEIATTFGDKGKVKSLSARYIYHFKKLEKARLISLKKIGHTYVAWPRDIDKLRFLHEMLKEEE